MIIEIIKWDEYNPRSEKNLKSMRWFRLESDMPFNPKMFDLSINTKWTFICILCLCAKKMSGSIDVSKEYLAHVTGIKEEELINNIRSLTTKELICAKLVPDLSPTLHNITLHNITLHNTTEQDLRLVDVPTKAVTDTKKIFQKPTIEQLQLYIKENKYEFTAEAFFDHYQSNGWKVGKNPMKDWKGACGTWQRNNKNFNRSENNGKNKPNTARDFGKQDLTTNVGKLIKT